MRRRLKGWRTVFFNAAAALPVIALELAPVVLPVMSLPELQAVLPQGWLPWWILGVTLGNMALRAVTDTPLGKAEK